MGHRFSNFIWGIFLLLIAAFILINQLNGFSDIGVGSIIVGIISLVVIVHCIAHLWFAALPIPLAVLYLVFQEPLNLPAIQTWTIILASVIASMGLSILLPHKHYSYGYKYHHKSGERVSQMAAENSNKDNKPSFSVNFGAISRHLQADSLETVQLYCKFGAMEIFFDQAEPSPNGAEVLIDCSFGAIKLFIPKHWQIIDKLNCNLGGIDIDKNFAVPAENTPKLTLAGNVSLGGIEIRGLSYGKQ